MQVNQRWLMDLPEFWYQGHLLCSADAHIFSNLEKKIKMAPFDKTDACLVQK